MSKKGRHKRGKAISTDSLRPLTDQPCSVNRSPIRTVFCRHVSNFLSRRFPSTSSSHFILGLPFLLLPSGLLSNILLISLPCSRVVIRRPGVRPGAIHPGSKFEKWVRWTPKLKNEQEPRKRTRKKDGGGKYLVRMGTKRRCWGWNKMVSRGWYDWKGLI